MKDLRKIVLLISVMLITVCGLTGCTETVEEGSSYRATIAFNDEYVTLYSPIESTVDVLITVSYSDDKSIDITKRISMESGETKVFSAVDFDENIFDGDSTITAATVVLQEYDDVVETIATIFLVLLAIVVFGFFFIVLPMMC